VRLTLSTALSLIFLLACSGASTPEAPEPESAPESAPEPTPPPEPGAVSISFTPEAICQGGQPVELRSPCGSATGDSAYLLEPGVRAGIIRGGEAIGLEELCAYGYAARIGDDKLAWWAADKFSSLEEGQRWVSMALNEACEPFPWSAGLVVLAGGKPSAVAIYDPRFRTGSGIQVGETTLAAFKALHPGGTQQESLMDGSLTYDAGSLLVVVPGESSVIGEVHFSLLGH